MACKQRLVENVTKIGVLLFLFWGLLFYFMNIVR